MDEIPKIRGAEKKEEKKKGFLAWLRSRLGAGGRNATGGAGDGAAGLGRTALGSRGLGASSGWFGGLLGSNMNVLFYAALLAAMGSAFYYGSQDPGGSSSGAAFKKGGGSTYVPAAMRQKPGGSSLDIFKEANKGGLSEPGEGGTGDGYDKEGYDKDGYDKEGYDKEGYDRDGYDRDGYNRDGYDRDGNSTPPGRGRDRGSCHSSPAASAGCSVPTAAAGRPPGATWTRRSISGRSAPGSRTCAASTRAGK